MMRRGWGVLNFDWWRIFEYDFMWQALVAGVMIAISASLVGAGIVLRRNSMIGDGLSHVAFGAFAIATVMGMTPLFVGIPVVILVSILILKLTEKSAIYGDSAIAVLSASSLAIGTFAISVTKGVNIDINSYLFGSILALERAEVWLCVAVSVVVILLFLLAYHKIFAITFDEDFAKSAGIKTEAYNALFAVICSVVIVLGMKLMGALLISSLIVFPTLSAMQVARNFRGVIWVAVGISVVCMMVGLVVSFLYETPTGASIVLVNLVGLGVMVVLRKMLRR